MGLLCFSFAQVQPTIIEDIAAFKSSLPLFPLVPPYHSQPTKSKLWIFHRNLYASYTGINEERTSKNKDILRKIFAGSTIPERNVVLPLN